MGIAPADHAAIATEAHSSSSMAANPVKLPTELLQRILAAS